MLQKVITALFAILVLLGCAAVAIAARSNAEQPLELAVPNGSIKGTLLLPSADHEQKRMPVALIIAGSGPTDRNGNSKFVPDNNSLKRLATALAEQGIASVRYDKRSIGASSVTPEADLRFDTYVDDAEKWLEQLRADQRFSKVLVVGHSEGALIGVIAAQRVAVSGIVSIGGTAMRASDLLRVQLKPRLPPELLEANESILRSLEAGTAYAATPTALQAIYRPSVQPYLISWFRYSPVVEISKVKLPLLIVQGGADGQVEPGAAEELQRANAGAKLLRVDGMDHLLRIVPAGSSGGQSGPQVIATSIAKMIE